MNSRRLIRQAVPVLVVFCAAGLSASAQKAPVPSSRGALMGTNSAVRLELRGVPNLHRISGQLYRSAQPTSEGMRELQKLGIKTVVNLRAFHSDRDEVRPVAGLRREHIHFNTWHPEEEDIVKFLKLVANTNTAPVLVHCQHGADRTGAMIAIYRIVIGGWSKNDAIAEMTGTHFGFHAVWRNLVRFIRELDVASLQKKAELPAAAIGPRR